MLKPLDNEYKIDFLSALDDFLLDLSPDIGLRSVGSFFWAKLVKTRWNGFLTQ